MTVSPASSSRAGLAWAALAVVIVAAYPSITRLGVTQQAMTPMELATLRYAVAGLVLLPCLRARGLGRRQWGEAAILALCQGTPLAALIAAGLALAPASHGAALTLGLMPAVTLLLGLLAGRAPSGMAGLGAAVIAAGAVGLSLQDLGTGGSALLGHAMFVLAAVMGSTYFIRLRGSGFSAAQGAAFVAVLSGAGGVIALTLMGDLPHLARIAPETLAFQAVFQGLLVGVLASFAMNRAIALLGPVPATVCMSLVPVAATVLAIPVLGEVPSPGEAGAVACMAFGAALPAVAPFFAGIAAPLRAFLANLFRRLPVPARMRRAGPARGDVPAG